MGLTLVVAEIEVAASMLMLGDPWGARRVAQRASERLGNPPVGQTRLCLDLVFAEADRIEGDLSEALDRLRSHSDYIATGSANWRLAMYIRAFPGLLALLVSALEPDGIPLRCLKLVDSDTIDEAMRLDACGVMPRQWDVVRARAEAGHPEQRSVRSAQLSHACYARTFGGFEVISKGAPTPATLWRKRKVRLLFAMLVARRGQDLPRDTVLEWLWPEMDETCAKRNFYVTWSAMKKALAGGAAPETAAHLVRCAGGICGVTSDVRSDLDDFQDALDALREADAMNDRLGVVSAANALVSLYRGEFLPGDVYEDWFSDIRTQKRHEFSDAMVRAARFVERAGDESEALVYLRKGSIADPWREDIYQIMMRCQMRTGQRSTAIETYLSCRGRLVDDLGIDPSIETTELYQAVLAMDADSASEPGEDGIPAELPVTSG
jgi:DNA-binding SARP family transcriptional activator